MYPLNFCSSLYAKYTIVVCYNDPGLYQNIKRSICGKVPVVGYYNLKNDKSIPEAYNELKNKSLQNYSIFLHQDVILPDDWIHQVDSQIREIEKNDIFWGVIGVMGVKNNGLYAGNIIDPHTNRAFGKLPTQVFSLDEVCLILRKAANLDFDESLGGFHFYGADICLQARFHGMKCYAINASLRHLSGGRVDKEFIILANKLKEKWSLLKKPSNTIETTCGVFRLNDNLSCYFEYLLKTYRRKLIRRIQNRTKKG